MYASVRHYKMGAGSIDSLMHHVDEEFAPALTQEPGFVCYLRGPAFSFASNPSRSRSSPC
jgi:hypothetical protein